MDRVLEPLGNPVHGKGDEDKQTNDCGAAATTGPGRVASWVLSRFVLYIDSNHGNREPSTQCGSDDTSNERDEVDVSELLGDINASLEHDHAERDPWNPADETDNGEDGEYQEHDTA